MASIDGLRAAALVGTPYRAQGREPGSGLDCVGLVLVACGFGPGEVRRDYRPRGDHGAELRTELLRRFRKVSGKERRVGDLCLLAVAPDQLHLAIFTARGFVHADMRLRKVVETPGEPDWPVLGVYRRRIQRGMES